MSAQVLAAAAAIQCRPLTVAEIESRLAGCARLPSLRSIDSALRELLSADQRYTQQISEVIRRDPSLTARLLRLVNSVYYGLTSPVKSIEEAVFYLGVRQIRQLAMVTPVIEDFQKLAGKTPFGWRKFWQHCIGTAIITGEVTNLAATTQDEMSYVAGLVHDVGVIVMSSAFPDHFRLIYCGSQPLLDDRRPLEREILGIDHAELGALYLQQHRLPEAMVESARFHHEPEMAQNYQVTVAAVQIADGIAHDAGLDVSEAPDRDAWKRLSGWQILLPDRSEEETSLAYAQLQRSQERLPKILEGIV
ncbi:MAG TPA: HDOD domain-containing protein [Verrucomicrobiae bacterium]